MTEVRFSRGHVLDHDQRMRLLAHDEAGDTRLLSKGLGVWGGTAKLPLLTCAPV